MRARSIKPDFFTYEKLVWVSHSARLLLIGLWCLSNREGHFDYNPLVIGAHIFPFDEIHNNIKRNVEEFLEELERASIIEFTTNDQAKIVDFHRFQNIHPQEKMSRPRDKTGLSGEAFESFEKFWENYPRKRSKQRAYTIWKRLNPSPSLFQKIMSQLEKFKLCQQWQTIQYVPYPSTWLNNHSWMEEPEEVSQGSGVSSSTLLIEKAKAIYELDGPEEYLNFCKSHAIESPLLIKEEGL